MSEDEGNDESIDIPIDVPTKKVDKRKNNPGRFIPYQKRPTHKRNLTMKKRDWEALELLTEGHSAKDVAEKLGYYNSSALSRQIKNLTERTTFERVQEYRYLENMRLESMYKSIESKAFKGDHKSIELALKILDRRMQLLGLKSPEQIEVHTTSDVPVFQITLGNQPILPAIETTAEVIETTEVTNENQEKQISEDSN